MFLLCSFLGTMSGETTYEEIALHALANTVQTENEFVRAVREMIPPDKVLRKRWRQHQAARAAATPAPEGFWAKD